MKKVMFLIILLPILFLTSCIDNSIVADFESAYSEEKSFSEFCGSNSTYELEIEIEGSRLLLFLEKNDSEVWSGSLLYYERNQMPSLTEEIPVYIDGDELVIQSDTPKRIALTTILLYKNFDVTKCMFERTYKLSIDYPLEEIQGTYPLDDIKPYMENLYVKLFSNLTTFNREEQYFKAIEELSSFAHIKDLTYKECPGHNLSIGFNGDESILWNPGYGGLGDISLLVFERVS